MIAAETPFVANDPRLDFFPESHRYLLGDRELLSVTRVLELAGVADFSAPWFTEDAKRRGSAIHQAIALENEDALDEDTLDADLVPYLEGWRAYLLDSRAKLLFWERQVCDPVLGVAGTIDGIVETPHIVGRPRTAVVDIKPSLYPSVGPQLAAYRDMARWLFSPPVFLHRDVIELTGTGGYRVHHLTDDNDRHVWLAAVRIANWRVANDTARR